MTPTRWLIAAFWIIIALVGVSYMFQSVTVAPPTVTKVEKHWVPLTQQDAAVASPDADVRLIHYVPHIVPGAMSFTSDVVIKNFGSKKATAIQVLVQPYVSNNDTTPTSVRGPDEIPQQPGGDPMANITQWVDFDDLGPGETATQTLTFTMRSDADPAQSFKPKVNFSTVNP